MSLKLIISFLFIIDTSFCVEETYFRSETATNGHLYPESVILYVGENVHLKLREPLVNQQKCEYKSPLQTLDKRVTVQSVGCAIKIENITQIDEGFWRLISIRENIIVQSVSYLKIDEKPIRKIQDELNSPTEIISPENTKYCYVYRTDWNNVDFPQHDFCSIPNIHLDPEAKGFWNVTAGVDGQTEEVKFTIQVESRDERLETMIEIDNEINEIILKCNIVNIKRTMKFCRFARVSDNFGVHLVGGHGIGNLKYYGDGYNKGHCGMMIINPTQLDKSRWKCFIGLQEKNETTTVGAILDVVAKPLGELTAENVYGLIKNKIDIKCKSETAFGYCWFSKPNGSMVFVSEKIIGIEDQPNEDYQYNGNGFKLGQCGITILKSTLDDNGIWICHVGRYDQPQFERSVKFNVRVTESNLVTKEQTKTIDVDDSLLIQCTTIPKNTPLEYCRFYMPNGEGFSLNENITSKDSIMDNYYFDPNEKLASGYCSVVIKNIQLVHRGNWTCAGKLKGWSKESWDIIKINVNEKGLSLASGIGIGVGVMVVLSIFVVIIVIRYRKRRQDRQHEMEGVNL